MAVNFQRLKGSVLMVCGALPTLNMVGVKIGGELPTLSTHGIEVFAEIPMLKLDGVKGVWCVTNA